MSNLETVEWHPSMSDLKKVEWYAGQLLNIVDEELWAFMNNTLNVYSLIKKD